LSEGASILFEGVDLILVELQSRESCADVFRHGMACNFGESEADELVLILIDLLVGIQEILKGLCVMDISEFGLILLTLLYL